MTRQVGAVNLLEKAHFQNIRPRLLGVNIGSLTEPACIIGVDGQPTGEKVAVESNTSVIVPISRIKEMLNNPHFDKFKDDDDADIRQRQT